MVESPFTFRDLFSKQVPDEVLEGIAEAIYGGYDEAWKHCISNFSDSQVYNLIANYRRNLIERNIFEKLKQSSHATAFSLGNSIDNCYHLVVRCGHVLLTCSSVKSPGEMVPESIFRKQYARDAQISIFDKITPLKSQDRVKNNLYGIILHKPDENYLNLPEFILIRFPDHDLTRYLDYDPIDLKKYYSITPQEYISKPKVSVRPKESEKQDRKL